MQLASLLSGALYRLLPHETCTSGEWIASHLGFLSVCAAIRG